VTIFDFIWRWYEVTHAVSSLSTATSSEQQENPILGSKIVGIGYLIHMKTKTEYIAERPLYLRM